MTARDKDGESSFLSRWSQRKRAAEEHQPAPEAAATEAEPADAPEPVDPAPLPDIDTLDASSDFTVFMRKGVPGTLKQRALRKLWQVDPVFKHICMLDDYNQDFTDAAMVVPNLKTIYQVGRGMVLPGEDEAEPAAAAPDALPPPTDASGNADSAPTEPALPEPAQGEADTQLAAAQPSPADADKEARREQRRPGPRVQAAATPRADGHAARARPSDRSARNRRWGDA